MTGIKRLTPPQSRKVNSLIKKECCNCDNGHCILLDDGEECVCPQLISYSLLCKWFQTAVLPLDKLLYTMSNADVPIWEKYTLTIDEAAKYFRIGENKLRKLAEENPAAGWVIMNGNRIQIKRKQFEKMIDTIDTI